MTGTPRAPRPRAAGRRRAAWWTRALRSGAPALLAAAALCGLPAAAAAATSVSVDVRGPTGDAAHVAGPVALSVRAGLTGDAPGRLPPTLRALSLGLPLGFSPALDGTVPCAREALELRGPAACPPGAMLGAGSAAFVYVAGVVRVAATTEQMTLFRGEADTILLYLRVTRPAALSFVLPGTLTARAVAVDLREIAEQQPGGYVVVRSFALDIARGIAAGPCPAGAWTFAARLEFTAGPVDERDVPAACDRSGDAPDVTAPRLRVSARASARARAGARLAIRLSEDARVHVTLERRSATGYRRVRRASFALPAGAGAVRIRRAGGRLLRGGRYRARVRALDGAGLLSPKRSVYFSLR